MTTIPIVKAATYPESVDTLQRIIVFLVCAAGLCLLAYGYLMATTVGNMVAYRAAVHEASQLTTAIGTLEAEYIELNKSMTIAYAHELGFVDVRTPHFVRLDTGRRLVLAE